MVILQFYKAAGIHAGEDEDHIQATSRHRYRAEAPGTPPGFWNVNFSPQK